MHWNKLGSLPGRHGRAGMFAGRHGDFLFMAGGTNFPDKPMSEGGERCWHDSMHLYNLTKRRWRKVGMWPNPIAAGGSVTTDRGIVCVGGSNQKGFRKDTHLVSINQGKIGLHSLPDLPKPLAGMGIVSQGDKIFVLGGQHEAGPSATADFMVLNLARPDDGWQLLPPIPTEGIMNCVMATTATDVLVFGGIRIEKEAEVGFTPPYLNEAWVFRNKSGWKPIAALPHRSGAAPSPALSWDAKTFHLLGGADGSHLQKAANFFDGFPRRILAYDKSTDLWTQGGEIPEGILVSPVIPGQEQDFFLLGGETGPGLRARGIWHITSAKP